jgi:hypothetical protein
MSAKRVYPQVTAHDEHLVRAHTALIRYPRFKELHQAIRMCATLSETAGEPQCMALRRGTF